MNGDTFTAAFLSFCVQRCAAVRLVLRPAAGNGFRPCYTPSSPCGGRYLIAGRGCPLLSTLIDYAKLRRDLARAVARICPGWPASRRDDLVQSAVMRVMHVLDKPDAHREGNPPLTASYLYRVAHSTLIDELRRLRRQRETALEDEPDAAMPVARDDPERLAASREIGHGIQTCLAAMGRDRRLAVTLYLQGHSVPESARLLEWSVKRTENLVYRGLADLRVCLTSKGHHL
jgi:RNA polymerase sigma-70 factor (ECF subfamily)